MRIEIGSLFIVQQVLVAEAIKNKRQVTRMSLSDTWTDASCSSAEESEQVVVKSTLSPVTEIASTLFITLSSKHFAYFCYVGIFNIERLDF
jgi:hypothetical protein